MIKTGGRLFKHMQRGLCLFVYFAPMIASAGSGSHMGMDPNDWQYQSSSSILNPILGVVIFGVVAVACITVSILRMVMYLFSVLMIFAGISGSDGMLFMGVAFLLACVAGSLWDPEEGMLIGKKVRSPDECRSDASASAEKYTEEPLDNGSEKQNLNEADCKSREATQRRIRERSDRAVHGRASLEVDQFAKDNVGINDVPVGVSASGSARYTEPFDLVGTGGELLADIGVMTEDGFDPIFDGWVKVPVSESRQFSTEYDNQPAIRIVLAARFGSWQVIKIAEYEIAGIALAQRGIPSVSVVFAVTKSNIQIDATEALLGSRLVIAKL